MKSEKSKKFLSRVGFYGLLLFFALLRAVASYVFIVPNAFAPGGVGGIASIVYNVVNLYDHKLAEGVFNPAVTIFVLNLPLVIASFFTLNKQFAINTTVIVLGYSGFMALFSALKLPVFQGSGMESSLTIISALAGGVITGVALGGSLLTNSSAGGTDILGKIANKKSPNLIQVGLFSCLTASSFCCRVSSVCCRQKAWTRTLPLSKSLPRYFTRSSPCF